MTTIQQSRFSANMSSDSARNTLTTPSGEEVPRSLWLAVMCAKVADEYRGVDTRVLDLRQITAEFDYFVISSVVSNRQAHAVVEEADRIASEQEMGKIGIEGYNSEVWTLQDFGSVVLHVFTPQARELYNLERLWADAFPVDWRTLAGLPPEAAKEASESQQPLPSTVQAEPEQNPDFYFYGNQEEDLEGEDE